MVRRLTLLTIVLIFTAMTTASVSVTAQEYDILIRNARVLDGSGNPWFSADVAVVSDRIAAIGDLATARAKRVIDAAGLYLTPGFIDIHSHADDSIERLGGFRSEDPARRAAVNLVSQGVTTVVVNQDGRSLWPIAEQVQELRRKGIGPNAILLAGHGTIRRHVLGDDYKRPASAEEVARMQAMVRQAMQEGAWGLSAGLEYVPGRWSTTSEVVALVKEIAPHGVYISHQRSEGADPMWYWPTLDSAGVPTLIDAVLETITIGERTGATVVASHIKAKGAHYWGVSHAVINLIERARARGVRVWADQYPYNTSGTDGNTILLPRWLLRGQAGERKSLDYKALLQHALDDEQFRQRLQIDIAHEIRRRGGAENIVVFEHPVQAWVGKSLRQIADMRGENVVQTAIALQLEGDAARFGGGRLRGFSMSEDDLYAYMVQPWVATASDAGIAMPGDGPTHARFYGTFPRKIRRYVLEHGVITLEHALRSMTSLPATILGLRDRGMLRPGMKADLVLFSLEKIRDRATFFEPHQYAEGIEYVFINGRAAVDDGELTKALPGKVLTLENDGMSGRK